MIDQTDIDSINKKYFEIIEKKDYTVVIRSRNTGHYWCLVEQEYNSHRFFQISHRHHSSGPFHLQKSRSSIEQCCEYIQSHDLYHMERERKKNERRMRRRVEKAIPR